MQNPLERGSQIGKESIPVDVAAIIELAKKTIADNQEQAQNRETWITLNKAYKGIPAVMEKIQQVEEPRQIAGVASAAGYNDLLVSPENEKGLVEVPQLIAQLEAIEQTAETQTVLSQLKKAYTQLFTTIENTLVEPIEAQMDSLLAKPEFLAALQTEALAENEARTVSKEEQRAKVETLKAAWLQAINDVRNEQEKALTRLGIALGTGSDQDGLLTRMLQQPDRLKKDIIQSIQKGEIVDLSQIIPWLSLSSFGAKVSQVKEGFESKVVQTSTDPEMRNLAIQSETLLRRHKIMRHFFGDKNDAFGSAFSNKPKNSVNTPAKPTEGMEEEKEGLKIQIGALQVTIVEVPSKTNPNNSYLRVVAVQPEDPSNRIRPELTSPLGGASFPKEVREAYIEATKVRPTR